MENAFCVGVAFVVGLSAWLPVVGFLREVIYPIMVDVFVWLKEVWLDVLNKSFMNETRTKIFYKDICAPSMAIGSPLDFNITGEIWVHY